MRVAVGLSGGVDSSVAALLLKEAGHEVVGITMTLWREGVYRGGVRDACFGPGEHEDVKLAAKLCAWLGITHHVFDCADDYERLVLAYFRSEYLAGRTPNPCVQCNSLMKFGVLLERAHASGLRFDRFATGHYARLREDKGQIALQAARDPRKDQSYFLYRLTREQLSHALFPLGELTKSEVRNRAGYHKLEVADRLDSQDFYSGDTKELLNTEDRPGPIVAPDGQVLGTHSGYWHFTIGQRKGLRVSSNRPLYVIGINPCRNEVMVGEASTLYVHAFEIDDCRWLLDSAPTKRFSANAKVRSTSAPVPAQVIPLDGTRWRVETPSAVFALAPGQSAVLYDGDTVVGGGKYVMPSC